MKKIIMLFLLASMINAIGYAPISIYGIHNVDNVSIRCNESIGESVHIQNSSIGEVYVATVTVPDSGSYEIELIIDDEAESYTLEPWAHIQRHSTNPTDKEGGAENIEDSSGDSKGEVGGSGESSADSNYDGNSSIDSSTHVVRPNSMENEKEIKDIENFTSEHEPIIIQKEPKAIREESPASVSYIPFLLGIVIIFIGVHLLRISRL
ncbi:MAG: hypothetical protein ACLFP2_03055 [Candidatus Woesearchaeota archaeon]